MGCVGGAWMGWDGMDVPLTVELFYPMNNKSETEAG